MIEKKGRSLLFVGKTMDYILLVGIAIVMVIPFLWMISTSLKSPPDIMSYPPTFIPNPVMWVNYAKAWEAAPFARYLLNSLTVALFATGGSVFFSTLAGFGFAKYDFPGRNILFILVLGTLMVPFQMTMIPLYMIMIKLRWVDDLKALIVPSLASAFGTFLMRQFIGTIPDDLMDAARIDGCSEIRIFWSIILPLCKSGLAVLALFMFMGSWNEFLWALIVIDSTLKKTLPLGLATFELPGEIIAYGPLMAASVFVIAPIMILFVFTQKYMTKGIIITGLKG